VDAGTLDLRSEVSFTLGGEVRWPALEGATLFYVRLVFWTALGLLAALFIGD